MTGDSDAQPRHKLHYEIAKGGDTRHRRRHFSKSWLAAFGGRVVWSWCPLVCAGGVATQVCPASTVGRSDTPRWTIRNFAHVRSREWRVKLCRREQDKAGDGEICIHLAPPEGGVRFKFEHYPGVFDRPMDSRGGASTSAMLVRHKSNGSRHWDRHAMAILRGAFHDDEVQQ